MGSHVRTQSCCVTKYDRSTWDTSQCKALTNQKPAHHGASHPSPACQESSNPRDIRLTLRKPFSNSPAPTHFLCDLALHGCVSEPSGVVSWVSGFGSRTGLSLFLPPTSTGLKWERSKQWQRSRTELLWKLGSLPWGSGSYTLIFFSCERGILPSPYITWRKIQRMRQTLKIMRCSEDEPYHILDLVTINSSTPLLFYLVK